MAGTGKNRKNSGFTLIELIIVVLIISIMAVAAGLGINLMRSADTKQAARIVDASFTKLRTQTMTTRGQWVLTLELKDGGYQAAIQVESTGGIILQDASVKKLPKNVKLSYQSGNGSYTELPAGTKLQVRFQKSTGIVTSIQVNTTSLSVEELLRLKFTGGGRESTLTLTPATGKHYVKE